MRFGGVQQSFFTGLTVREKYNDEVPVVFIDGRKAFKYRLDRRQFLRALAGKIGDC